MIRLPGLRGGMGPEGMWNGRGCRDAKGCGGWGVAGVARNGV